MADNLSGQDRKKDSSSGFPTLEMLPEGSILQDVKIPRYDKDFIPLSLFTADNITVKKGGLIDTYNAYIALFNEDSTVKIQTQMKRAIFNQETSTLTSTEHIVIKSDQFRATGTGLTFHEPSQQGFLYGPCKTTYIIPNQQNSTSMNLKKMTTPLRTSAKKVAIGTAVTATAGILMAERPAALTEAEIQRLDQQAKPVSTEVTKNQESVISKIKKGSKTDSSTDQQMQSFLKKSNAKPILTKSPNEKSSQTKGFDLTFPEPPEDQETLSIDCDNGIYFHAEKGLIVYLKNVKFTSPEYEISCSEDLKFYIEPKKDEKHSDDKKGLETTDKLKRIVATGDVVFIGKDAKANTYIARAEEVHYDAKTQTIILQDFLKKKIFYT